MYPMAHDMKQHHQSRSPEPYASLRFQVIVYLGACFILASPAEIVIIAAPIVASRRDATQRYTGYSGTACHMGFAYTRSREFAAPAKQLHESEPV